MYLLAQFREQRAFPKLIRLIKNRDSDSLDFLLGDTLTEYYAAILCSAYDGNLNLLRDVIESPDSDGFARTAAVNAYTFIARDGHITRREMTDYFRYLIHERLKNENPDSYAPTAVARAVMNEHLFELLPDVKSLYDREAIDRLSIGGYDSFINHIFYYPDWKKKKNIHIDDTIKELEHWACYTEESKPKPVPKPALKPAPPADVKKKTGRNDPCPCGSGKKYKKCCLPTGRVFDKEEIAEAEDSGGEAPSLRDLFKGLYDDSKPYDLLTKYPDLKQSGKDGERAFAEFFSPKAIEIDIPVYKALHHRAIPLWVRRDTHKEDRERIDLLLEAFEMFSQVREQEHIESFAAFDQKYLVHYESGGWVRRLKELLEEYGDELSGKKREALEAVNSALAAMSPA
jgi:hypothetical protein